ncbi:hypothetical protein ACC870_38100, partial [Rhizobium ruizarguesonis]
MTISLIIWVLTLIAVACSLCINLARRRWRRLVSLLIAPLLLLGQRKSNAVGRYDDSREDTEQDQQQKG